MQSTLQCSFKGILLKQFYKAYFKNAIMGLLKLLKNACKRAQFLNKGAHFWKMNYRVTFEVGLEFYSFRFYYPKFFSVS